MDEISESAVYRNMSKLLDEGLVQRYQKDGSRKYVYQYVGNAECTEHIHLKCDSCGQIVHANKQLTDFILDNIAKEANFHVNILKTVFCGICENCS